MPVVTKDEAVSGFSGLTVVDAFLKERMPAAQKNKPVNIGTPTRRMCNKVARKNDGESEADNHIAVANKIAIIGGGILFSSIFIISPGLIRNQLASVFVFVLLRVYLVFYSILSLK